MCPEGRQPGGSLETSDHLLDCRLFQDLRVHSLGSIRTNCQWEQWGKHLPNDCLSDIMSVLGLDSGYTVKYTPPLACFKMTIGPPNIMTIWHNILHDIDCKKNNKWTEIDRSPFFSMFIKGKHRSYYWGKTEKLEIPFLARKVDQYWLRVYRKMRNSNIWWGMFPNKSWFCQYFL